MAVDTNDFRPGDGTNNILRKILDRLKAGITSNVAIDASDIEIGAVELKNGTDDTRAVIKGSAPAGGDNALVVRNIPSGTQAVSIGDGSNVSQGAIADAAVTNPASSGSVIALLKGIISKLAGTLTVSVSAGLNIVSGTFTRPNDSNPYAVSDVVCNSTSAPAVITFVNVASANGGAGYITKARLIFDSAVVTNAVFRLYLYSVAPTPVNDNAQLPLLYANRANRLGHVDFALSTEGTGSDSATALVTGVNLPFVCAVADRNLYGVLVAKAAYVPTAQGNVYVELSADLN